MKPITTSEELKEAIQVLELQQAEELILLKAQFQKTKKGFTLGNIIKSTFKDIVSNPDLKTDAINAAIGFTSGIMAKKLVVGKTINPLKKLLGFVIEMAVTNKVAQNADTIKSVGSSLFKTIFRKKETIDKAQ
jgi:hypothetical protein